MILGDGSSSIEIVLREMGPVGTQSEGDVGVRVAATAAATMVGGPFSGRNDTVWIGRDEWADFLRDLRELDRTRRGRARVAAMGPAEFQLTILATDRAGHMAAEGWVGREHARRDGAFHDRVSFRVELDPSSLPELVGQLEALTSDRRD